MKVAIRADASAIIGSGHVMRCLTLAGGLRARGCETLFVCRALDGHLASRIEADGFAVVLLPAAAGDEASDARETTAALADAHFSPDWVIVDHYGLGAAWEAALRTIAKSILAIDDLADRRHDCDLLLDQNLVSGYANRYEGLISGQAVCLLGPRYALLQPNYRELHERRGRRSGDVKRILIYFGGADTAGLTGTTLRAFLSLDRPDVAVDVVVATTDPERAAIADLAQGHANISVHAMIASLADVMANADLAVGASGTTSWERLCLGVPAIVVTLADNQLPIAEELHRRGCVHWLGDAGQVGVDELTSALRDNLCPQGTAWFNAEAAANVDGRGAVRVADAMLSAPADFTLRDATHDDVDLYFDWANEPAVRQQSFAQDEITRDRHVAWFDKRLASDDCRMFVLTDGTTPLGQIRFDLADGVAQIGYSLDATARGRGLAKVLVWLGVDRVAAEGVRSFSAKVKHGNEPSVAAFLRCGFEEGAAEGFRIFYRQMPAGRQPERQRSRDAMKARSAG